LGFNLAEDEEDESGTLGISWHFNSKQLVAILIGATLIFLSTIKTVPTGHTGIVTTFGRVEDYTLESGLHIMAPWKKVTNMDNRTQKATIEMGCFSSDIQEVNLVYTINYQIDKENAQNIYKTIGTNYFDTVVQPKALEAVKGVFALYNAESLVSSRATLSQDIEKVLAANLEQYNIQIISTSLENIDFTDAFTNAVEAKQVAEQNKLKAQTEQEQLNLEAQASAERKVIEAKADAESALIAAQNDAEVAKVQADSAEYQGQKDAAIMSNIGKQLRDYPELVNYYYVTGWDGKLPDTVLGESSNTLLNLE
jgi:regulator of protease activity HflC (stomatin/prohibitin superfamily)